MLLGSALIYYQDFVPYQSKDLVTDYSGGKSTMSLYQCRNDPNSGRAGACGAMDSAEYVRLVALLIKIGHSRYSLHACPTEFRGQAGRPELPLSETKRRQELFSPRPRSTGLVLPKWRRKLPRDLIYGARFAISLAPIKPVGTTHEGAGHWLILRRAS
ncbi:hypothetical protein GQ53DRAFT_83276 [Thozetella sp. PMI_491]|nr:hypothetical protein GQ53DRAFT_83276 [Thozetella sp. PMI_491]